ncbi:murein transglycosylase A [Desulfuromonas carbonis]|uniref:murein transglycosylase A n=1 Tax=Desulfuromonas sp. DDH964 TaxID=1823759 RepID=UPI00078EA8A7|nr:MltA domain-containing protein [Desulfuromonas sp. DDH964]AMV71467.1 Membrane-bound lytic murein transglycosylase A precursor [Desulfuromonas sp. DDH964]
MCCTSRLLPILLTLTLGIAGCIKAPPLPMPPAAETPAPVLVAVDWDALPDWQADDPRTALDAFRESCQALQKRPQWQAVCQSAGGFQAPDADSARRFFETYFIPNRVQKEDGSSSGLITGYYVPDLKGSRTRSERFRWPIYGVPEDLLVVDLRSVYPELGDYRLRGRLEGRRVVPYYSRSEIDAGKLTAGEELVWVEDPVELFFLQIQGSGRVELNDGTQVMVNYADQNGHPYRSIGKLLLDRGAMTRDQMSMQNIKAWARKNPDQVAALLAENPSYVFFRELPAGVTRPYGALGVQLTAERSLAVDPRSIPLGAPVFLATTWPGGKAPLNRLLVAQDTGGAIKGRVRADFYWGIGKEAGSFAGRMKQPGQLWVLLPRPEAESGETEGGTEKNPAAAELSPSL